MFEYRSVIMNTGFNNHFPVHEMNCAAKLRLALCVVFTLDSCKNSTQLCCLQSIP